MAKKITRYRDAGTGQYATKKEAEKHPKTTVMETDKKYKFSLRKESGGFCVEKPPILFNILIPTTHTGCSSLKDLECAQWGSDY